ncbi:hypothetical protein pb186bvf_003201 [Paramecium bursaria]
MSNNNDISQNTPKGGGGNIQNKAYREKLQFLQTKVNQLIKDKQVLEDQDYQYEIKSKELDEKRLNQIQLITQMQISQNKELISTQQQYLELKRYVDGFKKVQDQFIQQQKQNRDQIKSFTMAKKAQSTVIEQMQSQYLSVWDPFILLSKAQGLLDSQYDLFYKENIQYFDKMFEEESQFNSCKIIISFLSYKPEVPSMEQFFNLQNQGILKQIPYKLYFYIDFYDFPTFKTDVIVYENINSPKELQEAIGDEKDLKLIYEDYLNNKIIAKVPTLCFSVEMDKTFFYYMMFKNVQIRMVDAQTGINYGYCQIPLNQIVKGSEQSAQKLIETQFLSYDWKVTQGAMTISLQNLGADSFQSQSDFNKTTKSQLFSTLKTEKQKIVSRNPMNLKEISRRPLIATQIIKDDKRSHMIERINQTKLQMVQRLNQREDNVSHILAVENAKSLIIDSVIQSVIRTQLKTCIDIKIRIGEKIIESLEIFSNEEIPYNFESTDQICTVIQDEELQNLYVKNEIPQENRIQISNNKGIIKKGQRALIYLAFFSIDDFDDFEINLIILKGRQPIQGQLYKIIKSQQIVDLYFDYYKRPNTQVSIKLPLLFCFAPANLRSKPTIISDTAKAILQIDQKLYLTLSLKTPDVNSCDTLTIFIYRDENMYNLLLTIKVNVVSVPYQDISIEMGKSEQYTFQFQPDQDRNLFIYSSNHFKLWLVDPFDHEIELKKGKLYDIPYKVFQIAENQIIAQITIVDQLTYELLYTQLVFINASIPTIKQVYKLENNYKDTQVFHMKYVNLNRYNINLQIAASSFLIKPVKDSFVIEAGREKLLQFQIQVAQEYINQEFSIIESKREIKIFLYDIQNKIFECYLILLQLYE